MVGTCNMSLRFLVACVVIGAACCTNSNAVGQALLCSIMTREIYQFLNAVGGVLAEVSGRHALGVADWAGRFHRPRK